MAENKNFLLKSAMAYAIPLGTFWCGKYIFFMLSASSSFFFGVYWLLTATVPIITYYQTWRYRQDIVGGTISFFHAWQFGVLLYFFAALIVSLVHYVFYQYIAPPELLADSLRQVVEFLQKSDADQQMTDSVESMQMNPIRMAIQGILNNVFYGIFLSLPAAWAVSRKKS
ncbi:hypothetical protein Barb6XT_02728 [Bacteroidales bacterium Barb6XT]|nr:hypothetical protein Barb6XT_02728 [Bacteroidales bacterium Barb6XT]